VFENADAMIQGSNLVALSSALFPEENILEEQVAKPACAAGFLLF
jgi:pyruvoyl-dependent arginine decarboxylase (PvlArgDC)